MNSFTLKCLPEVLIKAEICLTSRTHRICGSRGQVEWLRLFMFAMFNNK